MSGRAGLRARKQADGVAISHFPYEPLNQRDDDEEKDLVTTVKETGKLSPIYRFWDFLFAHHWIYLLCETSQRLSKEINPL